MHKVPNPFNLLWRLGNLTPKQKGTKIRVTSHLFQVEYMYLQYIQNGVKFNDMLNVDPKGLKKLLECK